MSLRDDQLATLKAAGKDFDYYNIANLDGIDHLPYSLKVLVENLVRNIDGANITDEHVKTPARLGSERRTQPRDPVHAVPRDHAGLHRRALHRGPRHHA